jgi:hypothetical protein
MIISKYKNCHTSDGQLFFIDSVQLLTQDEIYKVGLSREYFVLMPKDTFEGTFSN